MNNLEDFLEYRLNLLAQAKDEHGFITEQKVLDEIMPSLLEAKLVDSSEPNDAYYCNTEKKHKLNAYAVNESGERLQLFIVDEDSISENLQTKEISISQKKHYENQINRAEKFIRYILAGNESEIQESDPVRPLVSKLISEEGFEQFDTLDIFLISLTGTISTAGGNIQPRNMHFSEKSITATIHLAGKNKVKKDFLVMPHLIDLNRLYDVQVATGNAAPLEIDFEKTFNEGLPVLKAADEDKFESYLCVLNADLLAGLYKRYSTRLLEKNVRSFLQFRGVNSGMKNTIRNEPEKFIAFNNGLTITATDAKWSNKKGVFKITSLTDFQIVNGGQTTATIYFSKKSNKPT